MAARVYLEAPSRRREEEFLGLVRQSRGFHRGWVAPPDSNAAFADYLKKCRQPSMRGFFVCIEETDALAAVVNVSQIFRGNFQNAYLGFYVFRSYAGKGYMTEALQQVLKVVFVEMKLHRVEANIQPSNVRSIALVKSLGFNPEGFSPKYLKVGGRWLDHERWATIAEDWRARRRKLRGRGNGASRLDC